ncbi:MAG: dTMP kinase [Arcobacter sp.]|nr:dTMP kinase [Arcobacter sp.]
MYIAIEGIDTAGTSTQLDILKNKYKDAVFTKEPGGTELGKDLREMVLSARAKSKIAEMFIFLADRAEHFEEIVKANNDKMIISDRSFVSGVAYAKDFPLEMVLSLNSIALDNTYPDKIIMLELDKDELVKRLSSKDNDGIESRGIEYLLEIQSRMRSVIEGLGLSYLIVDASLKIEEIEKKIEDFINE